MSGASPSLSYTIVGDVSLKVAIMSLRKTFKVSSPLALVPMQSNKKIVVNDMNLVTSFMSQVSSFSFGTTTREENMMTTENSQVLGTQAR